MSALLSNPVVVRAVLTLVFAVALLLFGVLVIRELRRKMTGADERPRSVVETPGFPLEAYHGVIQRLKEQEQELERLRNEAAARASATENISSAVLSNLASGVVLFNSVSLVQQANESARSIFGYASPVGLHARDLFRGVTHVRANEGDSHGTPSLLVQAVQAAITDGVSFRRLEADYVTPSGDARVLGITLSPVRTNTGQALGAACLVSDLTEFTELARQARTRESLAALGEMSAGIAHEFKNSLATISGYAQMLGTSTDQTARDFGERIRRATDDLTRVVTDFLNFARPQQVVLSDVELAPLLDDCAREIGVTFHNDVPQGFCIRADHTAIRQAFVNLFRNSLEAGGPATEVWASLAQKGARVEISVCDDGPGIPDNVRDKIFIPFFTTKPAGTGIGLALVHRIVTEHGGTITVDSPQEKDLTGTVFTLSFPATNYSSNSGESR